MKEVAPYIIFILSLIVSFCIWLVIRINENEKKIAVQNNIIQNLTMEIKIIHDRSKEERERNDREKEAILNKLNLVSEALAVAKSVMESLQLKFMKKGIA